MVMASKGWISVHREIQDHWVWEEKPFSKGQAWLDLLMMANHKDNKFVFNGELIEVARGAFITSELKLMERWGWSKSKVRNFLKMLENDSMITKKSDNRKTTLNIVNYSVYQDSETTERQVKDRRETTERPLKDTNNNENNENNEKKVYTPEFESFYKTYPNSKCKAQTFKNWKKIIKQHEPDVILESAKRYKKTVEGTEKEFITASYNFIGQKAVYLDYLPTEEPEKPKKQPREVKVLTESDQAELVKRMEAERQQKVEERRKKRMGV